MPVLPPGSAAGLPAVTARDVITNALMEIGAYAQGEAPSAADAIFGLSKLNRLLDQWRARRLFAYNVTFSQYVLIPNHQPHTIGPSGADFTVTSRPVKLVNANIIINTVTPNVRSPLRIRDDDWWANQRVQAVQSALSTDLYYSRDWPNGSLFLWPVPTLAYGLELETWTMLASFLTLDDSFAFPPGYEDAITYSLAESLCPSFGRQIDAVLMLAAKNARATIQGPNSTAPHMSTRDAGIPVGGPARPYFNYRTGR